MATNRHTNTTHTKTLSVTQLSAASNTRSTNRSGPAQRRNSRVTDISVVPCEQHWLSYPKSRTFLHQGSGVPITRHRPAQTQISGTTLSKARNRDIFVCNCTVLTRSARRSAGQKNQTALQCLRSLQAYEKLCASNFYKVWSAVLLSILPQ